MTGPNALHRYMSGLLALATLFALCACTQNASTVTSLHSPQKANMTQDRAPTPETDLTHHLYLEEVLGERALDKVRGWNERSLARLESDPLFETMQSEALEILNSKNKIPYVSYRGGAVHNFWQDADSVRGIWRTTSLESYLTNDPDWETIIDYDALSKAEDKNWVYKGNNCLAPNYNKCLISLSDGGKDAVVRREFDVESQRFIEDGFTTPESKGTMDWLDADTVVIGIDFGQGSLTDSGYPRIAKLWKRGTPLSQAVTLGEGAQSDVGYWPGTWTRHGGEKSGQKEIVISRSITFYDSETYWVKRDQLTTIKFPLPKKSDLTGEFKGQALLRLNEDWRGFKSGDLVSFSMDEFMANEQIDTVHLVYAPHRRSSIDTMGITANKLLISIYENVQGRAYAFDWDGHKWSHKKLGFPVGTVSIGASNPKESLAFISTEGFLTPPTLWTYDAANEATQRAKALPDWFDSTSMQADQFEAISSDGERIPYFVVRQKSLKLDGSNPALLYGYGGFEVSLNPSYSATRGKLWLERGGIYVLANIRGGGEFGPDWHQAGLKTQRQIIYDDFISVAESLIDKGLTSPAHLGIEGGSNGGLLMGVMFTQRPDLFSAIICQVPLLDMRRYHTLLAGASWMSEYGDPEDAIEGAFLKTLSPYHNIHGDIEYPEIFFVTSTKDDRVHPAHARKMAARLEDLGKNFLYYENIDGGHSASANLKETAKRVALQHVYLMQKLSAKTGTK